MTTREPLYERESHYGVGENDVPEVYVRKASARLLFFSLIVTSAYLRRNNIYRSLLKINFDICFS